MTLGVFLFLVSVEEMVMKTVKLIALAMLSAILSVSQVSAFEQVHLKKLKWKNKCEKCNLRKANAI